MKLLTPDEFEQTHGQRTSDLTNLTPNEWRLLVSIRNMLETGGLQVIHNEIPSDSIYCVLQRFGWSFHWQSSISGADFVINLYRA